MRNNRGISGSSSEPKPPKGASIMQPETLLYPVRVRGDLDPALSRWQWLVKWILAVPHYIVLFFLHIASFVVTVIAFFAILFTGKYPRGCSTSMSVSCAGAGGSCSTR